MVPGKKLFRLAGLLVFPAILGLLFLYNYYYDGFGGTESEQTPPPAARKIATAWKTLSGNREGKVVFARPPQMVILDLTTGLEREVPGVVTAGAPGRRLRGETPRPFWSPLGDRFVYRYNNNIYVCDVAGKKQVIFNEQMDCSKETRWSWYRRDNVDWLVGPSKNKNVILVKVSDPAITEIAYSGEDVLWHCELTGSGRFVVYDDDSDIYVTPFGSSGKGIKISSGQSCRPCASPDDRVAWLPAPHTKYMIYKAEDGSYLGDLKAPPNEEIYRLNWSNEPDFAVHMFGSNGNTKMNVRKVSTGEYIFVGNGWDPDVWVGAKIK